MLKKRLLAVLTVSMLLLVSGCGPKLPDGMPKLYPAKVTVLYDDGTPVAGATISLIPVDAATNADWASGGTTGEDGSIELFTRGQYQGVPASQYKVTVKKGVPESGEPKREELDAESYKLAVERYKNCSSPEPYVTYNLVDPAYGTAENTTLEMTVEAKGNNKFELKVGAPCKLPL